MPTVTDGVSSGRDTWLRLAEQLAAMLGVEAQAEFDGGNAVQAKAFDPEHEATALGTLVFRMPEARRIKECERASVPPRIAGMPSAELVRRKGDRLEIATEALEAAFFWLCVIPARAESDELSGEGEVRSNFLDVDVAALDGVLASLVPGWPDRRHRWPGQARFAACLSHDIDIVHWGRARNSVRRVRRAFGRGLRPRDRAKATLQAFEELYQAARYGHLRDSEVDLGRWLDLEQSLGVTATYFFAALGRDADLNDPIYKLGDVVKFRGRRCALGEALNELAAGGAEIGLHGSIHSHDTVGTLTEERKRLAGTGPEVCGVRQHYLRAQFPETFERQREAGFTYDSSLGFNRRRGFRCGTSFPWQLEDWTAREDGALLWELPLCVQDVTLPSTKTDRNIVVKNIEEAMDAVEETGGVLTILWHNYAYRADDLDARLGVYREIVEEIQRRRAWITTGATVIEHWARRRSTGS